MLTLTSVMRCGLAGAAATLLALALSSCALFQRESAPPAVEKPARPAKPAYNSADFVLHLSLAQLILANDTPDGSATRPHFEVLESYAAQKRKKTELEQPVLLLTYTKSKNKPQTLTVPFIMPVKRPNFPALREIMTKLAALPYAMRSVEVGAVPVLPQKSLSFTGLGKTQVQELLAAQQQQLLEHVNTIPPLEEAYIQIQLTRFFMNHRIRDEAYLTLENAKRKLAEAVQEGDGTRERSRQLAEELEALENQLHESMPFTLGQLPVLMNLHM